MPQVPSSTLPEEPGRIVEFCIRWALDLLLLLKIIAILGAAWLVERLIT